MPHGIVTLLTLVGSGVIGPRMRRRVDNEQQCVSICKQQHVNLLTVALQKVSDSEVSPPSALKAI
jgi:hypothetical protein